MERLLNSLWKAVKTTLVGTVGSTLLLLVPVFQGLLPKPAQEIDTPEKIGLAALLGLTVGLLDGLKRYALWRASRPR